MNILDLLAMGIEAQMSREKNFVEDAITFRFRKGEVYYERILKHEELVRFNGGGVSSPLLEDIICRQVAEYFGDTQKKPSLNIDDWVICSESGVIGRIIKIYTPTACEEQIMVKTRGGRKYHAPAIMWKSYQFGTTASQMCTDEYAIQNPLHNLNAHGRYADKFAQNHGISIDEALRHPTVKAHLEYLNKVDIDNEVLLRNPGLMKEHEMLVKKEIEKNCAKEFLRRG